MTALEKAAMAVYDHRAAFEDGCWVDGREYLDLHSVVVDGHVNLVEVVRAVLMAVREPDASVVAATNMCDDVSESFTAMIDAILSEKTL